MEIDRFSLIIREVASEASEAPEEPQDFRYIRHCYLACNSVSLYSEKDVQHPFIH